MCLYIYIGERRDPGAAKRGTRGGGRGRGGGGGRPRGVGWRGAHETVAQHAVVHQQHDRLDQGREAGGRAGQGRAAGARAQGGPDAHEHDGQTGHL